MVYRARDRVAGTHVAVKILREDSAGSLSVERFIAEIRRTSQLTHAHIAPILDSGEHQGRPFYVLPLMDGGTLRDRLHRSTQLPLEEATSIGITIAGALDFAHQRGVIHRDVKPENILFTDGRPCLADFGTARAMERAANDPTTSTGIVRGTAAYMSPEQASGEREYDGRTDIYSLGCVLYEAIAGIQPFVGPSVQAVISQRLTHAPRPVSVYRPLVPPELEAVLAKATAMSPADRFQSAREFARALEATLPLVRDAKASARTRAAARRKRMTWRILAASIGVVGIAVAVMTIRPPLDANDWLLVADFQGPLDDPALGGAVRDLATEAFRQSRFVQVIDRRQLNEVMRRANMPETSTVTPERARELAVRRAVNAVLQGSVRRMDSTQLELVLHVVRPNDGASLGSAVRTAGMAEFPQVVQSMVDELRSRIGEHKDAIAATRPLRNVATPSFAAFRLYSEAMDRLSRNMDITASSDLLHKAIDLDSAFAFAWVALAANYGATRQYDSSRLAMAKAIAFPDRLTPGQLYRLKGDMAFTFDHDVPGALEWYDRVVAEGRSAAALSTRGLYRTALGQYEQALPDFRDAAAMNPFGAEFSQPQLLNYAAVLVVVGRTQAARAVADSLTGQARDYLDVMLPVATSQWTVAESVATAALGRASPGLMRINATTSLASAVAARGDPARADSILAAAALESRGASARWYERARLELALARGAVPRRRDVLPSDTSTAAALLRALWASAAGDTVEGRRVLRSIATPLPVTSGAAAELIQAWIDLGAGRPHAATDRLAAIGLRGEHDPLTIDRPDALLIRWTVATAYERLGRPDSAAYFYALLARPANMPPMHFALRGLTAPVAEKKVLQLQGRSR